ncbi:MAG: hypothetical protein HY847_04520 [Betaproteobacteria bacterium]|nr:hypothetical protein [Betaproteobacteria bacterium]
MTPGVAVSLGDALAKCGWRTGSVVPHAATQELESLLSNGGGDSVSVHIDDWLIVVSQTCDVVAKHLEAEPFVEVLLCSPIKKLRTQFKDMRSTRILDFRPNRETHEAVFLTAHAVKNRFLVPRNLFVNLFPDEHRRLSSVAARRIMAWFALRYSRPAWPEAFVSRLRSAEDALEAALEPLRNEIAEVRIALDEPEKELDDGQPYSIVVYFVVDEEIWNKDAEARADVYAAYAAFTSHLNNCDGISVNEALSGVKSGEEFSWQATRATDEWNFANLTHRD